LLLCTDAFSGQLSADQLICIWLNHIDLHSLPMSK